MLKKISASVVLVTYLAGCAAPGGPGSTGQQSSPPQGSQGECIAAHIAVGAVVGGVIGAVVAGGRGAARGALAGGLSGLAVAWMSCITKYAKAENRNVQDFAAASSAINYSQSQGTVLRISQAYLEPAAVSGDSQSKLRVAYYVMDGAKDIIVQEKVDYQFELPNQAPLRSVSAPQMRTLVPGLNILELPISVPKNLTEGKLTVNVELSANQAKETTSQTLVISSDQQILKTAAAEADQKRSAFEQLAASRTRTDGNTVLAQSGDKGTSKTFAITAGSANLRAEPSGKAKLVKSVPKGTQLPYLQSKSIPGEGTWYQVNLNGAEVWVGASQGKLQ